MNKIDLLKSLVTRASLKIKNQNDNIMCKITEDKIVCKYYNAISGFGSEIHCHENIFGDFTGEFVINNLPLVMNITSKFDGGVISVIEGKEPHSFTSLSSLQIKNGRIKSNIQLGDPSFMKSIKDLNIKEGEVKIKLTEEFVEDFKKFSNVLKSENSRFSIVHHNNEVYVLFGNGSDRSNNNIKLYPEVIKNDLYEEFVNHYETNVFKEILMNNNYIGTTVNISDKKIYIQIEEEPFVCKYAILNDNINE